MSKKYYQTEWLGIQFSKFIKVSSTDLANSTFYQSFYKVFFDQYKNLDQLSLSWRQEKRETGDFILKHCDLKSRVLSIGCGLGMIEYHLKEKIPQADFFINEVTGTAWRWIEQKFDNDHRLLGFIPECLPSELKFDLVYMVAVDYAIDDNSLVQLMSAIKPVLNSGGKFLMISVSLDVIPVTIADKVILGMKVVKRTLIKMFSKSKTKNTEQFWGWMRTREEYNLSMKEAGFQNIEDGFFKTSSNNSIYWISGK